MLLIERKKEKKAKQNIMSDGEGISDDDNLRDV